MAEALTANHDRSENSPPTTPRGQLLAGARSTMPFLTAAIPMGIAGGVLGVSSGLSEFATLGLAMAVNSGTAQFVGLAMIAEGASYPAIILTTLILGLRMLLYSTILIPHVKEVPQRWRVLLGFGLIDEVFFVAVERLRNGRLTCHKHLFFVGASGLLYVTWMTCTAIGMTLGSALPDLTNLGLDFPVTGMFVAMLAIGLANWRVAAAIGSAGVTVLVAQSLPHGLEVVLAALVGATIGAGCELATRRNRQRNTKKPSETLS